MKKILIIVLALVLALGTMGVGYARWSQQVAISGTVASGNLCVHWSTIGNYDQTSGPPAEKTPGTGDWNLNVKAITGNALGWVDDSSTPNYYQTDKHVATMSIPTAGLGTNSLTVTVTNAYPLYGQDVELEFKNCGTIPVSLSAPAFTPGTVTPTGGTPTAYGSLADYAWLPNNGGPIWVTFLDGNGYPQQLDPGQTYAGSFKFVVQEDAIQGATYTFTVTWNATQWNENP